MNNESPYLLFRPGRDPQPCSKLRATEGRVVISVALKKYENELHAVVSFGRGTEWVRRKFRGLIHPTPQATLCPFDDLRDLVEVLNDRDYEVVVERRALKEAQIVA